MLEKRRAQLQKLLASPRAPLFAALVACNGPRPLALVGRPADSMVVLWIASRNALLAVTFGFAALVALIIA